MQLAHRLPWRSAALLLALLISVESLAQEGDDDEEGDEGAVERVIYQYTDLHGVTYMVDDLNRVPLPFRTEQHLTRIVIQDRVLTEDEWDRERGNRTPDLVEVTDRMEQRERERDLADDPPPPPPSERIAELEIRQKELQEQLAMLEEGSGEPGLASMTPEQLEAQLTETLNELSAVETELEDLRKKTTP